MSKNGKSARDNRSNQLNPNNGAYRSSRGLAPDAGSNASHESGGLDRQPNPESPRRPQVPTNGGREG